MPELQLNGRHLRAASAIVIVTMFFFAALPSIVLDIENAKIPQTVLRSGAGSRALLKMLG